jgi:putative tryptophan/tyrosine transport system substrate-binding protein
MRALSRRRFVRGAGVAGLGVLAACGRLPFEGTPPVRPATVPTRIGFLSAAVLSSQTEIISAFRQGLADYGQVEGRDITIEWRLADGAFDQMPALAAELLGLPVAVIVVPATPGAQVIQRLTRTVPIVVAGTGGDPVADGLATSFARPGGNVTGLSIPAGLAGKRLQLLMEVAPDIARVAVLRDANTVRLPHADYEALAREVGVEVQFLDVERADQLESIFAQTTASRTDALLVEEGPILTAQREMIVDFAAEHRLPAMYFRRLFVDEGGLLSYESRLTDLYRRAAYYVDRILKGATPADLSIEQPMTFDFVINLKTAQALSLTIPPHVLAQATEVIQ